MATGHLNPGFIEPISSLYRNINYTDYQQQQHKSLTADLSNKRWLLSQPSLPIDVLDKIRREAREKWADVGKTDVIAPTSYSGNYQFKLIDEPVKVRPASPTRRNNPHPPIIFLRCRLHQLPGFHGSNRPATSSVTVSSVSGRLDSRFLEDRKRVQSAAPGPAKERQHNMLEEARYDKLENIADISQNESSKATNIEHSTCSTMECPKTGSSIRSSSSTSCSTKSYQSSHPFYQRQQTPNQSGSSVSQNQRPPSGSKFQHHRPHTSLPIGRLSRQQAHRLTSAADSRSRTHNHTPTSSTLSVQGQPAYDALIYHKNQYPRRDYSIHYQWPVTLPHHQLF